MKFKKVFDYVFDVGTLTEIDFEEAKRVSAKVFDKWDVKSGCTAFAKTLDDGRTIVARNLDLNISNKPAFIYKTAVEGYLKTIGLMYFYPVTPDYKDVLENGVDEDFKYILPFVGADIMNENGLYIETNMRTDEYYEDGTPKFASSGTNPESDNRVCLACLPAFIAHNAKNIEEALEYIKTLDIYSITGGDINWPLAFLMADTTGRYGVLEIVNNEIIFNDMQPIQTNFYINEKYQSIEDFKAGYGENSRYEVISNGYDKCTTPDEMWELVKKVSYFQSYYPKDKRNFDNRTEFVHQFDNWTSDYLYDPKNAEEVEREITKIEEMVSKRTRQELQDACTDWESTFSLVADTTNKTIKVRFFEDDEKVYTITF